MTGKLSGHLVAWQAPTTLDTFRTSMAVVVATRSDKWWPNSKFCYRPLCVFEGSRKIAFKPAKAVIGISRRPRSRHRFSRSFRLPTVRPFSASGLILSRVSVGSSADCSFNLGKSTRDIVPDLGWEPELPRDLGKGKDASHGASCRRCVGRPGFNHQCVLTTRTRALQCFDNVAHTRLQYILKLQCFQTVREGHHFPHENLNMPDTPVLGDLNRLFSQNVVREALNFRSVAR